MDYIDIMKRSGWEITHIIDCPLSLRGVGSLRAGGYTTIPSKPFLRAVGWARSEIIRLCSLGFFEITVAKP